MKMYRILLMIMVYLFVPAVCLLAQVHQDTTGLSAEMAGMQITFSEQPLSFDIRYTYAGEQQPEVLLDSMQSNLLMAGTNFRYSLNKIMTISNGRYHIVLFMENKLMYVKKVEEGEKPDPFRQVNPGFPVVAVKSWSIKTEGIRRILHIDFKEGAPFRTLDIRKDTHSGHLMSMRYVLKADHLPAGTKENPDLSAYGTFAILQIYFEHYKTIYPDKSMFDEHSYFNKEGTDVKPTSAYSDYQVFKASPNL
jgi:hypothetical protein